MQRRPWAMSLGSLGSHPWARYALVARWRLATVRGWIGKRQPLLGMEPALDRILTLASIEGHSWVDGLDTSTHVPPQVSTLPLFFGTDETRIYPASLVLASLYPQGSVGKVLLRLDANNDV